MTTSFLRNPLPLWPLLTGLASGLLIPFSLTPWQIPGLGIVALALLFLSVYRADRRRTALLAAYLHGLACYGLGAAWLFDAIRQHGAGATAAWATCVLATAGFALYPMLAMGLARWLGQRRSPLLSLCLLYPASYVVVSEWFRGWFLTGNTWLSPGYAAVDGWLSGLVPLGGLTGANLALALLGSVLAGALLRPQSLTRLVPALGVVTILLFAGQWGQREWTQPAGEAWRLALVQANVPQDQKWDSRYRSGIFESYRQLTEQALQTDADIVIWPETALPVWLDEVEGNYLAAVLDGLPRGRTLVLGAPTRDGRDGPAFNSVLVYEQAQIDRYDKRHLVPFAEFTPLRNRLGDLFNVSGDGDQVFQAGQRAPLISLRGEPVAVAVCFEIIFGHELRPVLGEAKAILTLSDDSWFGDTWAPHQHLQMARFRALESGKPVIRATNTGISALITSSGRVQAEGALFQSALVTGELTPRSGLTPYVRWGDWPILGLLGLVLGVGVAGRLTHVLRR